MNYVTPLLPLAYPRIIIPLRLRPSKLLRTTERIMHGKDVRVRNGSKFCTRIAMVNDENRVSSKIKRIQADLLPFIRIAPCKKVFSILGSFLKKFCDLYSIRRGLYSRRIVVLWMHIIFGFEWLPFNDLHFWGNVYVKSLGNVKCI